MANQKTVSKKYTFCKKALVWLLAAFFAVNLYGFYLGQNDVLSVATFEIKSSKISAPVTIVQLSDLHEKSFGRQNSRLFDAVRNENPDLIAITGDIIYNSYTDSPNTEYMETLARGCADIAPAFFVTGNHDRFHEQAVKDAFSQNGVCVLDENVVSFQTGGGVLDIGGIDDASLDPGSIDRFHFPDTDNFRILLAHKPDAFRGKYDHAGADLVLSGHTHGGQIRLPGGKAIFYADGGLFPEYSDGVYTSGDATMVVSMGLGSSVLPFRLFAQPEVTVIRLLPQDA